MANSAGVGFPAMRCRFRQALKRPRNQMFLHFFALRLSGSRDSSVNGLARRHKEFAKRAKI